MTLHCAIFLFQLRKGGYISKGNFCLIFIKVKEIKGQLFLKFSFWCHQIDQKTYEIFVFKDFCPSH